MSTVIAPARSVSAPVRILAVLLAIFTVPPLLGGVIAGVALLDGGSASARHSASLAVGPAAQVTVRAAGGIITVEQGSPGRVTLAEHDSVHGLSRAGTQASLDRLHATLTPTAAGVTVDVPAEAGGFTSFHLGGPLAQERDITLDIPPGATLRLDSGPGVIRLSRLSGPVDVSGSAGLLVLDRFVVSGDSRLRLTNGGIGGSATMAGGSLDAAVVSGGIRLALTDASGARLQATSANGNVDLPHDFGIAISKIGSSASASGVIGGGTESSGSLTLDTVNGVISLSAR